MIERDGLDDDVHLLSRAKRERIAGDGRHARGDDVAAAIHRMSTLLAAATRRDDRSGKHVQGR